MISEPEAPGEEPAPEQGQPEQPEQPEQVVRIGPVGLTGAGDGLGPGAADVIGGHDPGPGRWRTRWGRAGREAADWRRLGAGVAAGAVLASAAWVLALRGTNYGRAAAPDLHGYHLGDTPCASANFEPLTEHLPNSFLGGVPEIRKGPALDHVTCDMVSPSLTDDGWITDYDVTLTIDLHKKTDPRAEFADTYGRPAAHPGFVNVDPGTGGLAVTSSDSAVVTPYPGIGDLAYLSADRTRQSLSVLHGGAVLTLTVNVTNSWGNDGTPPADSHGVPTRPPTVTTSALRPYLAQTLTHLMRTLSR
ncbi:hypothetical protein [Streptomyces sp. HPF1205]|uniref:hypothetical protein n=1 Tax=Streptomyces sp. HPF1205 TaxID=2873262 RepID=UPI001CED6EA6|nr:hypothetical protein [Streptomyces sp. HPF1205]